MDDSTQRTAAAKFAQAWHGRGNEKSDTQTFWLSLLAKVFGVRDVDSFIQFEKSVERLGHAGYIDAYIPSTKVLIEQKSLGIDLDKAFTQAKEYADYLPLSQKPRWIVVSDFATFRVHDMEKPLAPPEVIELKKLAKESHRLKFLIDTNSAALKREEEISLAAGRIIGELYDAFLKLYGDNPTEDDLRNLNVLCVRIVFCLYAEDAGILPKNAFYNYLNKFISSDIRVAMRDFFETLNTKPETRDRFLDSDLARLPYVNGGLFDGAVSIPPFSTAMRQLLLEKASLNFDWSAISPTIFGAVFESTLNPETRRKGGMHYTSVENIHKVIDPLFLDALKAELNEIIFPQISQIAQIEVEESAFATRVENNEFENSSPRVGNSRSQLNKSASFAKSAGDKFPARDKKTREKLLAFQQKLASLTFLDPACGSGNFLTETYLSLRRLENEVLRVLLAGQSELDLGDLVRVNIHQFYGIEINDFAVTVAKTALWIAESQMLKETEDILHRSLDFLPLKTYSNIVEANALTLDWETVVPRSRLSYIIGNPPFVDGMMMSRQQHDELAAVFPECAKIGEVDYVVGWYAKAARMIAGTSVRCAFVSTNSICQGQSVEAVWRPLTEMGVEIDFAWRTFRWDSESIGKAHVHCVIVGFSCRGDDAHTKSRSHEDDSRLRSVEPTAQENDISQSAVAFSNRNLRGFVTSCETIKETKPLASCEKTIFSSDGRPHRAANINPYLIDAPNIFIASRSMPICDVPAMAFGSMPRDGGGFILTEDERRELIAREPLAEKWIRLYLGAEEFINKKKRYCLWLVGAAPHELRACPTVMRRVESVRDFRAASKAAGTRKFAATPTLFCQIAQPDSDYILIPGVSSEKRSYVPIGFVSKETIASNLVQIIPNATLYHFGVLTSSVHMAWMRAVCGRLKSDYRYSKDVVYNNFPWPEVIRNSDKSDALTNVREGEANRKTGEAVAKPSDESELKISQTAQAILDARARYPDSSLADLYDELTMPPDLRAAHAANDRAVLTAYGFPQNSISDKSAQSAKSAGDNTLSESAIVAELMRRYQALLSERKHENN